MSFRSGQFRQVRQFNALTAFLITGWFNFQSIENRPYPCQDNSDQVGDILEVRQFVAVAGSIFAGAIHNQTIDDALDEFDEVNSRVQIGDTKIHSATVITLPTSSIATDCIAGVMEAIWMQGNLPPEQMAKELARITGSSSIRKRDRLLNKLTALGLIEVDARKKIRVTPALQPVLGEIFGGRPS